MRAKVILNPFSGRWAAQKRWPEAETALREVGVEFELAVTDGPRHATELARDAVQQGFSPIIAAGGDGSIGEVVNGIAQAGGDGDWSTLGIMPLGTANDLVANLGLPADLQAAARVIASGATRMMDVCRVNESYFVNNAGLGLESHISVIQNRMTWARGMLRYLLATFLGIAHNPQWYMQLTWDDGEYEGPVSIVSVSNGPRTGGIFYTVPHADPFDGKLSFVHGFIATRREILRTFPKILRPEEGNYIEHPHVHEYHATWLRVHAATPTPMHVDGEVVAEAIQDLAYSVLPARLPVLMGR